MPKPENNVIIGFCANPACGRLHVEILAHPEHGDIMLVLDTEDARAFAEKILKTLDNSNVLTH